MATASQELRQKHCTPCEGGQKPLPRGQVERFLSDIPGWQLSNDGLKISKSWRVEDFTAAMEFLQHIATIAESEDHHPDLHLTGYRNVHVELMTHAAGGLTENDFILAARINDLPVRLQIEKRKAPDDEQPSLGES